MGAAICPDQAWPPPTFIRKFQLRAVAVPQATGGAALFPSPHDGFVAETVVVRPQGRLIWQLGSLTMSRRGARRWAVPSGSGMALKGTPAPGRGSRALARKRFRPASCRATASDKEIGR